MGTVGLFVRAGAIAQTLVSAENKKVLLAIIFPPAVAPN